jgi:hypothetical protein
MAGEISSGSFLVAGFGTSGFEPSGSAATALGIGAAVRQKGLPSIQLAFKHQSATNKKDLKLYTTLYYKRQIKAFARAVTPVHGSPVHP